MTRINPIMSIMEAREIRGNVAVGMSDDEIAEVIDTLDLLAKEALEMARHDLQIKRDAKDMANLIYDIYQDKKRKSK